MHRHYGEQPSEKKGNEPTTKKRSAKLEYLLLRINAGSGMGLATMASAVSKMIETFRPALAKYAAALNKLSN
jgi:hypothetical protein